MQRLAADTVTAVPPPTYGVYTYGERVLVNRGRSLLHDGSTALEDCEIYDGDELYLLPGMQIFVKTLTSAT